MKHVLDFEQVVQEVADAVRNLDPDELQALHNELCQVPVKYIGDSLFEQSAVS